MGIPFQEKELEAVGVQHMRTALLKQDVKVYNFPVPPPGNPSGVLTRASRSG